MQTTRFPERAEGPAERLAGFMAHLRHNGIAAGLGETEIALAALGAYALIRQLGTGRTAAAVGAAGYAYAPWLLSQAGHLHIVSNGGIPLALAMLARRVFALIEGALGTAPEVDPEAAVNLVL